MPEGSPAVLKCVFESGHPAVAYRADNETSTRTERIDNTSAWRENMGVRVSVLFSQSSIENMDYRLASCVET